MMDDGRILVLLGLAGVAVSAAARGSRGIAGPSASRETEAPFLPLSVVDAHVPRMEQQEVSTVARSGRGFLTAYRRAEGDPSRLSPEWLTRREGFIARHVAQVRRRKEPLWRDGVPTRRHLALIAWAHSPDPDRLGSKGGSRAAVREGRRVAVRATLREQLISEIRSWIQVFEARRVQHRPDDVLRSMRSTLVGLEDDVLLEGLEVPSPFEPWQIGQRIMGWVARLSGQGAFSEESSVLQAMMTRGRDLEQRPREQGSAVRTGQKGSRGVVRQGRRAPRTVAGLCKHHRITLEAVPGGAHGRESKMARNWRLTLRRRVGGRPRVMSLDYFGGSAVKTPSAESILMHLLEDLDIGEDSFENFLWRFGREDDAETRKGWRGSVEEARKLKQFLGNELEDFKEAVQEENS